MRSDVSRVMFDVSRVMSDVSRVRSDVSRVIRYGLVGVSAALFLDRADSAHCFVGAAVLFYSGA